MTGTPPHPASISYRADIQGLRACAVVAVVIFHALPQWLPGGFLGVDIFFVVSGYLITAILTRELSAGSFSLVDFYRRRIIRILPALTVMVAVSGVVGCLVLLPGELRYLGRSMVWAMAFAGNISFYRQLDYFGGTGEFHPLLHSWSLGVEEQFYLFYPLALATLFRFFRAQVPLAIALVSGTSLLLALALNRAHPTFVFYMLPTRVWELGAGALVATLRPVRTPPALRDAIALAGLASVVLPMLWVAGGVSPYPACVIAVLGAATLLYCGQATLVGRMLGLRTFVALGAISYSLYLWHWPVLSFYRIVHRITLTGGEALALICVSLVLAILSWFAIEQPLMKHRSSLRAGLVFPAAAVVTFVLGAFGLTLYFASSAIVRLPPEVATIEAVARYTETPEFHRQGHPPCPVRVTQDPGHDPCLRLDPSRPNILVIGDSFSRQIWHAVAMRNPSAHVLTSFKGECRPLFGTGGDAACRAQFDYAMHNLARPGGVDAIVLAARWTDDELVYLAPTIRAVQAHGIRVVVIGPVVEYDANVPDMVSRALLARDSRFVLARRLREREQLDRRMSPIVHATGATYVSLYRAECPASGCRITTKSGLPIHWDRGHLTLESAMELTEGMPPVVPAPPRPRTTPGL